MSTETVGDAKEKRSCVGCPSFLPDGPKVAEFFGTRTTMDHCARFGHILGHDSMHPRQADGLRKARAANCHSYGLPAPRGPVWEQVNPSVTLPTREAMSVEVSAGDERDRVDGCRECVFFNQAEPARRGWQGVGICSSRNELVFKEQSFEKSQRCGSALQHSRFADNFRARQLDMEMRLIPDLVDAFYKVMTPLERWRDSQKNFVDPTEYPSDRPVFQEDLDRGIRAWREVVDQETGYSVYIPIYDTKHLPEHLQRLVPQTGDDEHPENFIDYEGLVFMLSVLWWEMDETPALWGPAGVGKTEVLRHMAWLMQLPFHRISITASTEVEELVGQFTLKDGETKFVHGRLPRAWASPGVICLDEPNVGPVEVWQAIRPLTDNSKQFVIDKNGGEVIKRHDDSVLGIAMNPAWDTKNIGADLIADADSSRLSHISVSYPPVEVEREIMREWANDKDLNFEISEAMLDTLTAISADLRGQSENGSLSISWGVRHNIKVAKLSRVFPLQRAYSIAVGNFLDPREREIVRSTVATHVS